MSEEVATSGAFTRLLSPFTVGRVNLRNRIVFQPHFTALGHTDGMPSDEHVAYHEERAIGGVGLIVFESQAVHPTGKMSRRFVNAWDPAIVPRMAKVADAVHRHGAKLFGQLTHGGHTSLERPPPIMWAPTQMSEPSSYHSTKAMDEDDIRAVIVGFAASARNMVDAGLDGVEIKIAHDGLLRSFASPFFNRRTDRYGGSFENRMRLSLEVVDAIKQATGPDVPLGVRMCVNEFTIFGYDEEYGLKMAATLEATGQVDYFNSDAGSFSSFWMEIPPAAVAANDFRKINAALKKASRIPVIAFGRLAPTAAEALLASGEADLVGMARPLIADPEIPNKLAAGRGDLIRVCVACNDACVYQAGQEKPLRCIHNPGAGRERTMSERLVTVAPVRKRIVVAGGGPAGLKVAEVAARRGHHVTLLERAKRLGGQVLMAAAQPEHDTIGEVTAYLEAATTELGVTIKIGTEATVDSIRALTPDIVVVATGSEPNLPGLVTAESDRSQSLGLQILPEIEGLNSANVVSCDDVLSGRRKLSGGVIVVDQNGHWEAAGTAEFLADAGCRVTVIATHSIIGENLEDGGRTLFFRRAAIKGITLRPETSLVAVEEGKVRVSAVFSSADAIGWGKYLLMPGDDEVLEGIDFVVPVIGRRSREALFLDLKASPDFSSIRVERVGDCVAPRLIQMTISEAFELARDL
jgi:2,4-dienoyl-CoA reductase-like NADH-dependent reductase (Old Yellow Enzyme family)/pyruvate/2-oxoglutarate dehydrogenase complex dihydrolipoamide dehydrogenase (E3) component